MAIQGNTRTAPPEWRFRRSGHISGLDNSIRNVLRGPAPRRYSQVGAVVRPAGNAPLPRARTLSERVKDPVLPVSRSRAFPQTFGDRSHDRRNFRRSIGIDQPASDNGPCALSRHEMRHHPRELIIRVMGTPDAGRAARGRVILPANDGPRTTHADTRPTPGRGSGAAYAGSGPQRPPPTTPPARRPVPSPTPPALRRPRRPRAPLRAPARRPSRSPSRCGYRRGSGRPVRVPVKSRGGKGRVGCGA